MLQKHKLGSLDWIDLESPTGEEIKQVVDEYKINPLVARELAAPTIRPRVDLYHNFIYLILHFPSVGRNSELGDQEIDFIIGREFLITAHYREIDVMHSFAKTFEVESILNKRPGDENAGFIFFKMLSEIYDSLTRQLEGIKNSVGDIERRIFKGREPEMVMQISRSSRDILDFRRATGLHKEILDSLEAAAVKFFGDDFRFHIRGLIGDYCRVENVARSIAEFVAELRETNNSLLSAKQGEITKTIAIIAFIFLPFSVITGFFQMNTVSTPMVGLPYDWFIAVGSMAVVAVILFLIAKYKKWL